MKATTPQKAVIYCRVSSKKQVREGGRPAQPGNPLPRICGL